MTLALVVSVGIPAGVSAADTAQWSDLESEFVVLINDLRESVGQAPLEVHPNLKEKAREWAGTMAAGGRIWHSDLSVGITADWHRLGENVGVGPSVERLHAAFVASPSHYENLVRADFEYIGIGIVVSGGRIYVAEEFMTLRPAPVVTTAPPSSLPPPPVLESDDMEQELARLAAERSDAPSDVLGGTEPTGGASQLAGVLRRLRTLDG